MSTINKYRVPIRRNSQGSIRVYARIHPLGKKLYKNYKVKEANNVQILRLCPPMKAMPTPSRYTDTYDFTFEKVFSNSSTQEDIFEIVAVPIVNSVFTGINGTIFAYGQTGTGKTYTMTGGRGEDRGLQPRIIHHIFTLLKQRNEDIRIALSYLEIYNEMCFDLLNPKSNENISNDRVSLLEDTKGRLHVRNLTVQSVHNEDEAFYFLSLGEHNRSISATPDNPHSSRSHCMLIIHFDSLVKQELHSKLNIVDLAGSERLFKPNTMSQSVNSQLRNNTADKAREETRHINLSLHYLEQVIICLSRKCPHVPYRNSMMTTLLRDSLGGNCLTAMIATLSLALRDIEETISTCRFAQRVALVSNTMPNDVKKSSSPAFSSKSYGSALSPESKKKCEETILEFLTSPSDKLNIPLDHDHIFECFRLLKERAQSGKSVSSRDEEINELKKTLEQRNQEISTLINLLKKNKHQINEEINTTSMIEDEKIFITSEEEDSKQVDHQIFKQLQHLLEKVRVENFFESKSLYTNVENDNCQNLITQEIGKLTPNDKVMLKIYLSQPAHTNIYDDLSEKIKENYSKMKQLSKIIEKEKDYLTHVLNSKELYEMDLKVLKKPIDENLIYLKELRTEQVNFQKSRLETKWEIICQFKKWLLQHSKEAEAIENNNYNMIGNFIEDARNSLKLYLKKYDKRKKTTSKKMITDNDKPENQMNSPRKSTPIYRQAICIPTSKDLLSNKLKRDDSLDQDYNFIRDYDNNSSIENKHFQSKYQDHYTGSHKNTFLEEIPIKLSSRQLDVVSNNAEDMHLSTLDKIRLEIEKNYRTEAASNENTHLIYEKTQNYNVMLTGDPEIDEEIQAFYSTRKKFIHQI